MRTTRSKSSNAGFQFQSGKMSDAAHPVPGPRSTATMNLHPPAHDREK
jgi:hypothetical protein